MKRWLSEMSSLVWTLAGTALVLITLSGSTRAIALWISGIALVLHLVLISLNGESE